MKRFIYLYIVLALFYSAELVGQETRNKDAVAENMLLLQRNYGGWSKFFNKKKVDYYRAYNLAERKLAEEQKGLEDATIDNNATSSEIRYLIKAFHETKNQRYLTGAKNGVDYLLDAQYANGGWPQYYPDTHLYRSQITYNDRAMINVLLIMQDIVKSRNGFDVLAPSYVEKAKKVLERGLECIIHTQVILAGKKTIWAAQYDKDNLQPAKARAYELPSLATAESSDILLFLMEQPESATIQEAVEAGVQWFSDHKLKDKEAIIIDDPRQSSGKDRVLIDKLGTDSWARFYDLNEQEPLFVGRDGKPHKTLFSIENERRIGYAWYGNWGNKVDKAYKKWKLNTF
ncbi:pectate lyase [Olivibacter domesticus]|uniref:Pectate lyase, PelA/Pel-15E family n=1 Tax=Olivibacter domesticus TaxID=407022 RepID=A0A1H7QD81_OLID1|nr:pectate lyase [Olivibacter domesticus]SEL45932.1 pectate lyase, PelA/Pel-15E family [Olivibacter domesticus]